MGLLWKRQYHISIHALREEGDMCGICAAR